MKNRILPGIIIFLLAICGCQNKTLHKDTRVMMGTYIEVTSPDKGATDIAFREMERIERLLNKYDPASEISRLNKSGRLKLSGDTFYILEKAKEFWKSSDGAFDVTVGPLMDLWGFTQKKFRLPKEEEIRDTLKRVGFEKIILHPEDNMVEFKIPGIEIDLGAIGKGYAVDCAVRRLMEQGVRDCLIDAGGDIYCLGDRFGEPWNIAVQDPRRAGPRESLKLKDRAVATSGDYEQYFMHRKKRYTHIFNPKTGYPTDSGVVSVTVIAPDCLTADALATSIFVLGKDRGREIAKRFKDVEVEIIDNIDNKLD